MNSINRLNQLLLKNYPLVWNTKLVWLLLAAVFFHILFFGLGFMALSNPVSLHGSRITETFFNSGSFFLSVIISIILIFLWLIFMFKNNGFKSFYPTSRNQLFGHLVFYFLIIFFNTTYFYSHFYGMKAFIHLNYPEEIVDQEIDLANRAAPFFSHFISEYEIDKKLYPKKFEELYCETNPGLIDFEKPLE